MKIFKSSSHIGQGIVDLLDHLNISINGQKILSSLSGHPSFPNPPAVIDCLTDLKIKAEAVQGEVHQIAKVQLPGLAMKYDEKEVPYYQLVTAADDQVIMVVDQKGKTAILSHEEFSKNWRSVFILITKDQDSGDSEYFLDRKKEQITRTTKVLSWIIGVIFSVSLCITSYKAEVDLISLWMPYLIIKIAGLFISVLLVRMDVFNIKPDILNHVCHDNKVNDCNAVINSVSVKILGVVGLSEIGFMYYSGSIFLLLISLFTASQTIISHALAFLGALSLLTFPFTIYSIIQQSVILKKFCTLCLVILVLLWIDIALTIFSFSELLFIAPTTEWMLIISLFLFPGLIWLYVRDSLTKQKKLRQIKNSYKWSKLDTTVFNSVLEHKGNMIEIPTDLALINLGNPESKVNITMVSDSTCPSCANAYFELEYLLRQYSEDINISILSVSALSDIPVSTNWLSLYYNSPSGNVAPSIHHWYHLVKERGLTKKDLTELKKVYKIWLNKFDLLDKEVDNSINDLTLKNLNWSKKNITYYPTIIVNGCRLPKFYSVNDLKFLIEELFIR